MILQKKNLGEKKTLILYLWLIKLYTFNRVNLNPTLLLLWQSKSPS